MVKVQTKALGKKHFCDGPGLCSELQKLAYGHLSTRNAQPGLERRKAREQIISEQRSECQGQVRITQHKKTEKTPLTFPGMKEGSWGDSPGQKVCF